jgi:hypothetical protein
MSRKLIALNLCLVAALAAAGWKIRENYVAARARQEAFLARSAKAAQIPAPPAVEPAKPIQASEYLSVAQQMVFAKDRNPNVIIEVTPPKPVPAFPVAFGVLALGGDMTAILSEKGKQKGFRPGDQVGEFKLASITTDALVFEWDGQQFKKTLAELKAKEDRPPAPAQAPSGEDVPRTSVQSLGGGKHEITKPELIQEAQKPKDGGPGIDIGGSVRACVPGENSPPGTIMGGYRKFVNDTPFGKSCRWEPIR